MLLFANLAFAAVPVAPAVIELALARQVAADHLTLTNRTYSWRPIQQLVLYDVDGQPAAYAFLFAKQGTPWSEGAGFAAEIARASDDAPTRDLATVITGALESSPLILRHVRGLPDFWREIIRMRTEAAGRGGATDFQAILVTPLDIRIMPSESAPAATPAPDTMAQTLRIDPSGAVKAVGLAGSSRIDELRRQRQQRQELESRQLQQFPPEDQQRLQRARTEQIERQKALWEERRKRASPQTRGGTP